MSGMIADYRRNLGRVGKIETLSILQICPRSSQTIGDIYDFEFSVVGKIWEVRETVKSRPSGIFPTYENQALKSLLYKTSRGGSRGKVQGVRTPPPFEMKPSSSYWPLKFVYLTVQWRDSLEVHPLLRKILDSNVIP